ncbi:hypothetical protein [Treponema socranskii]|uniref:hypothetical protein n=1 Tax=Treponema socranskii TaxID=53419 RepID=UPI0028E6475C|nr:hypothetical protein [Treponema socranskii]
MKNFWNMFSLKKTAVSKNSKEKSSSPVKPGTVFTDTVINTSQREKELTDEQKSFRLTQFLTEEMLQMDKDIGIKPQAIKKATVERIDKHIKYIAEDMQYFKKDAQYGVPEEYYRNIVHDYQEKIADFDILKRYCQNMSLKEFAAHLSVKQIISAKQCLEDLDKKDSAKTVSEPKQTEFDFSDKETPCYNPANGKVYASPEFESHLKAINSDDKRYLSQSDIIKFGFTVKSEARPILLNTERLVAGKIRNNYELLYNGKDIIGLPPLIEKEKNTAREPARSIAVHKEKEYEIELG